MEAAMKLGMAGIIVALAAQSLLAQDSVDVTFRYTNSSVSAAEVRGEFTSWGTNPLAMANQGNGLWTRTVRLRLGGSASGGSGVPGAWQYKFYYNGASPWPNDPLNHHVNRNDNDNTFIITHDPTFYQFLPNQRNPLVHTNEPTISAYIYPKVGAVVDPSTITLRIDGSAVTGIGSSYDQVTNKFSYTLPAPIINGSHTVVLSASTDLGGSNSDTVTFVTQGGFLTITTQGGYTTRNPARVIRGLVEDTSIHVVQMVRNGTDTTQSGVNAGAFSSTVSLSEGLNTIRAVVDSGGTPVVSDPVQFSLFVNHSPNARIDFVDGGATLQLAASGSTDPDPGQTANLTYLWTEDSANPGSLGINGSSSSLLTIDRPSHEGLYAMGLIATDPTGLKDTTRSYFTVLANGNVELPTLASNPPWAQKARVYFLFPKAASPAGTIPAAASLLQHIKDMGFNVVWMMPVMKNAFPINNGTGPGYNIIDFYNVAPEYGTNDQFKDFVAQAHALGLKVILDVTPNHSSRFHPWCADAHQFKQDSRYWSWYEHTIIPHNDNGLGQSLDADGFSYYSGFSEQLMNLNWNDVDLRAEMINVYKYWIQQFGIDGYRFDVYWGPHRRYGEASMGKPVRDALKHIKPDILLLAEDDGTGTGTETIYADYVNLGINGGVDAAYDFSLYFNQIRGFGFSAPAIDNLHNGIYNNGFYPGANALYMRFMESQDEDRIVAFYSNNFALDATTTFMRTMPMASVVFTVPGFPMLWNGQEVGWGYGITGAKEARNRSVIDWNYQGKTLLSPHYQKLATIRGQFPAFTGHKQDTNGDGQVNASDTPEFVRAGSSASLVYAFTRPYLDQNGLTVVNFSGTDQTVQIDLTAPNGLAFTEDIHPGTTYFLNNLYSNTHQEILGSTLGAVTVSLPPYGTAIYTVSTTLDTLKISNPVSSVSAAQPLPMTFGLEQNYPNPFNPTTVISYQLSVVSQVKLVVFDILGREVAAPVNGVQAQGKYTVRFDGSSLASGLYFYRIEAVPADGSSAGIFRDVRKMMLVK